MRLFSGFWIILLIGLAACQSDGIKTEHGYRFINHTNKTGIKPQPGDFVLIQHYVWVGDSMMSSTARNFGGAREYEMFTKDNLPVRVPAIYDALLLMSEGDSGTVYEKIDTFVAKFIPPSLKDVKEVRHEIALFDVITREEKEKQRAEVAARFNTVQNKTQEALKNFKAGKLPGLISTSSGLKIYIEDKGSGKPIKTGEQVMVHYYGCLMDGTLFDNSYQRGETYSYPANVGQMIPGFDEGVMHLNRGGKAILFIPARLGYGAQGAGPIPPNSDLVFYVETY
ncbi:MAG: FKBP-type peptidyl-prolyl cis-trans isomerase [Saprospiraceae bacterium]|nr:FKBP-type peptidyl-prolyl cis-trans isomerase [Saprospiraceae bacterium]MDW8229836.1 FKBP-type peptidyl-prolyl cis-trans isomerase [Saprospiraceae bacterium]